jgi:hypothetical protein
MESDYLKSNHRPSKSRCALQHSHKWVSLRRCNYALEVFASPNISTTGGNARVAPPKLTNLNHQIAREIFQESRKFPLSYGLLVNLHSIHTTLPLSYSCTMIVMTILHQCYYHDQSACWDFCFT